MAIGLLSALLNSFKLVCKWAFFQSKMHYATINSISAQTIQEGVEFSKIEYAVLCPNVLMAEWPINQFKQVQQSRQQVLRDYCSNSVLCLKLSL
jgi:hypothetical protein